MNIPKTGINAMTADELDAFRLAEYRRGKTIAQVEEEIAQLRASDGDEAAQQYARDVESGKRHARFAAASEEMAAQREEQQRSARKSIEIKPGVFDDGTGYIRVDPSRAGRPDPFGK